MHSVRALGNSERRRGNFSQLDRKRWPKFSEFQRRTCIMQSLLKKLVVRPTEFTSDDLTTSLSLIASGTATPVEISSFLTALKLSGLDAQPATLATAAQVMRSVSVPLVFEEGERKGEGVVCDIVGTGGDGQNTFNVSTTAGIVAAGAGCRVYKVRSHLRHAIRTAEQRLTS